MNIHEKLERLRERDGLTVDQVADRLDLHRTQYHRYEKGGDASGAKTRGPKYGELLAMARLYGVPMEWLADDAQNWPPPTGAGEVEKAIYLAVRTMGPEEAYRRLMRYEGGSTSPASGPGSGGGSPGPPGTMSLDPGPRRPRIRRDGGNRTG
jgi:transcriptional regulator with XRE-family HTH domain